MRKKEDKPKSRLERLGEGSYLRKLPEADERLCMAFSMLGMCESGGMGSVPLSWQEIRAFSEQSSCKLSEWESEQIAIMSREYVAMQRKATDNKGTPAPYQASLTRDEIAQRRDAVSSNFAEMKKERKARK